VAKLETPSDSCTLTRGSTSCELVVFPRLGERLASALVLEPAICKARNWRPESVGALCGFPPDSAKGQTLAPVRALSRPRYEG